MLFKFILFNFVKRDSNVVRSPLAGCLNKYPLRQISVFAILFWTCYASTRGTARSKGCCFWNMFSQSEGLMTEAWLEEKNSAILPQYLSFQVRDFTKTWTARRHSESLTYTQKKHKVINSNLPPCFFCNRSFRNELWKLRRVQCRTRWLDVRAAVQNSNNSICNTYPNQIFGWRLSAAAWIFLSLAIKNRHMSWKKMYFSKFSPETEKKNEHESY